jgi:hypothetical protein
VHADKHQFHLEVSSVIAIRQIDGACKLLIQQQLGIVLLHPADE